jgi:Na+/proline symporter
MHLHVLDIVIIVAYLLSTVLIGYWVSHRASQNMQAYSLGGNKMSWYLLGISNASGMFDISGTMLLAYWMFIYGMKSVWIPWLWQAFNQIFLMVYLSAWLRRSKVMTGAEWIKTRFGTGRGAQLSHFIVVVYAFVSIIGFFSYGFKGIGKFAATFLPGNLSPNEYALILIAGLLTAFMSNFAATVNAAPPYFVNDIYKRYIRPDAPPKTHVCLSYISSFAVVVIGVLIGWNVTSVNSVVLWIVSGLWAGYTASNVLKWYWWRFNGYGYFWGMVTGIVSALVLAWPDLLKDVPAVQSLLAGHSINLDVSIIYPLVLVISLTGCLFGTLLTKPDEEEVLKDFYRRVRPWGFWGPALKKVLAEDPGFKRNKDFLRDMFNTVAGIVWQIALVALPLYIVIKEFQRAAITLAVVLGTSAILKFTWFDHLAVREVETDLAAAGDK